MIVVPSAAGSDEGDEGDVGRAASDGGREGVWETYVLGSPPHPAYAAAAVAAVGPMPVAVTVRLDCPPGTPSADRDILRRVAAAVRVDADRPRRRGSRGRASRRPVTDRYFGPAGRRETSKGRKTDVEVRRSPEPTILSVQTPVPAAGRFGYDVCSETNSREFPGLIGVW